MSKSTKKNQPLYFVFAGEVYYPDGGAEDFIVATTSLARAKSRARKESVRLTRKSYSDDCWATVSRFTKNNLTEVARFCAGKEILYG